MTVGDCINCATCCTYHFHRGNYENGRIFGFNSNNLRVDKACARIPDRSHRCAHCMRSVATRVSTAWWGRLPGLRTFPRSVARAKSIQPEEFRRPGYPFCAEEGTRRTESCEQGDGKKRWMTVRRAGLRIGEMRMVNGERRGCRLYGPGTR